MGTKNILFLLLIACLFSHLLHAGADCVPRSFRYLLPAEDSSSSDNLAPAPSPNSDPECLSDISPTVEHGIIIKPTATPDDQLELSLDDTPTLSLDAPTNSSATSEEGLTLSLDKPTPDDEPTNLSTIAPEEETPTPDDETPPDDEPINPLKKLISTEPTNLLTTVKPGMLENPIVKKICESTGNPLLCFSSLGSLLPLHGPFDPVALMQNEIKACNDKAKTILAQSEEIAADPSTAPDVSESLGYCKENYDSALMNLDEAVKGIATRDVGLMNSMLSAVISDISTCQDTFSEMTTSPNPMAEMGETVSNLASNCLAILDFLHW